MHAANNTAIVLLVAFFGANMTSQVRIARLKGRWVLVKDLLLDNARTWAGTPATTQAQAQEVKPNSNGLGAFKARHKHAEEAAQEA